MTRIALVFGLALFISGCAQVGAWRTYPRLEMSINQNGTFKSKASVVLKPRCIDWSIRNGCM